VRLLFVRVCGPSGSLSAVCVYACLSGCLSDCMSVFLYFCLSVLLSIYIPDLCLTSFICMFVFFIYRCDYRLSAHKPVCLYVLLSGRLPVCSSVCLSAGMNVCTSGRMYVFTYMVNHTDLKFHNCDIVLVLRKKCNSSTSRNRSNASAHLEYS
jgi:hypothetical protein